MKPHGGQRERKRGPATLWGRGGEGKSAEKEKKKGKGGGGTYTRWPKKKKTKKVLQNGKEERNIRIGEEKKKGLHHGHKRGKKKIADARRNTTVIFLRKEKGGTV